MPALTREYPITRLDHLSPTRNNGYCDIVAKCIGVFLVGLQVAQIKGMRVALFCDGSEVNACHHPNIQKLLPAQLCLYAFWIECENAAATAVEGFRFGSLYLIKNCRVKAAEFGRGQERETWREGMQHLERFEKLTDSQAAHHQRREVMEAYQRVRYVSFDFFLRLISI